MADASTTNAIIIALIIIVIIMYLRREPVSPNTPTSPEVPTESKPANQSTANAVQDTTPAKWIQKVRLDLKVSDIGVEDAPGSYLNIMELEVYNNSGVNIARGRPVASSGALSSYYRDNNLVDGDITTMAHSKKAAVGETVFIEVDLPPPSTNFDVVSKIVIHNNQTNMRRIIGTKVQTFDNAGAITKEWTITDAQKEYSFNMA